MTDRPSAPSAAPATEARRMVPPRDALERSVRRIWADVLQHRDYGVYNNFFEVGGSSLGMLEIQERIKDLWGYHIPLAALFTSPTISGTAVLLRGSSEADPASASPLVCLSASGSDPPVFCFHPLGGSAAVYYLLARALPDHPVYGLQAIGLSPGVQPQHDLAEMSSSYTHVLRSSGVLADSYLVGFSLGGIFALSTARSLWRETSQPPVVVLIDAPTATDFDPSDAYRALGSYALNLDLDYDSILSLGKEAAIAAIYEAALNAGAFSRQFPIERLTAIFDTALANIRAASGYDLGYYPGELLVIGAGPDSSYDWAKHAAKVTHYSVGLPHALMLEEKSASRIGTILRSHYLSKQGTGDLDGGT